jgi:hypothetical protein
MSQPIPSNPLRDDSCFEDYIGLYLRAYGSPGSWMSKLIYDAEAESLKRLLPKIKVTKMIHDPNPQGGENETQETS